MEANTAFMPTPDLLHHRLHMNCVIAKFPVGERSTDYAYLTKTSVEWRLILVELEDSSKKIFKKSSKNSAFTADFNDAVAQIDVWQDYVKKYIDQLRDRLQPLLIPPPMAKNRLLVSYVLVIGRSEELDHNETRRFRLASYQEQRNLRIITYDSIIRMVKDGFSGPKAVLRTKSRGYLLQSVEAMPTAMFAYIMPEHLELAPSAEEDLRSNKFDLDEWKRNKPLIINDKWTPNSDPALFEEMHPITQTFISRIGGTFLAGHPQ